MRTYEFVIGVAETGMRLDQYLTRRLPASVSRAMIQRAIREGLVTVEGRTVRVHHKLHRGDRIEARFTSLPSPPKDITLMPQAIPLDVVYEDAELLVVNKPAGLVTHPAPGHWDGTLVNAILWHLEQTGGRRTKAEGQETERCEPASALRPPPRAGIIHRLDKDTSGLLLVAKTEEAHVALSRQLKARTVNRRYLALVEGHLPLHMGTINAPIGRHATHRKVMTVRHLGGRSAVTHYRVIKRLGAEGSRLKAEASSLQRSLIHWSKCLLRRAGRTRSECTWRMSAIRSSATPPTASARRRFGGRWEWLVRCFTRSISRSSIHGMDGW